MVYETTTKLNCEQVKKKAQQYFGKENGLEEKENSGNCLNFEGGGGHVNVTCCPEEDGPVTVELETREWDRQVKSFMKNL
ncbi:MAG: hypothetical protein ACOC4G_13210 [Bacillota bacterium]